MAGDPAAIARGILDVLADAELLLIERIGRRLAKGASEAPAWMAEQRQQLHAARQEIERVADGIYNAVSDEEAAAIWASYRRGAHLTDAAVGPVPKSNIGAAMRGPAIPAIESLLDEAKTTAGRMALRIQSSASSQYARIIAETGQRMAAGQLTRREATAVSLARWARQGITGFQDKAGRNWNLASYGEMTARTATAQAQIAGQVDRAQQIGQDFLIVSDAPEECQRCRPYEGRILSTGKTGTFTRNGTTFTVVATVGQATANGLFHPNCRHTLSVYLPGITRPYTNTADPEGDRLRQQQRAKERAIRRSKREAAAYRSTLGSKHPRTKRAEAKVRRQQAEFKAWRDAHGRKDLAYRTSIRPAKPPTERATKPITRFEPARKPRPVAETPPPPEPTPAPAQLSNTALYHMKRGDLDDELRRAYESGDDAYIGRVEGVADRRDRNEQRRRERAEAKKAAQQEEISRRIAEGQDPIEATADVTGRSITALKREDAIYRYRASLNMPTASFDELLDAQFKIEAERQMWRAEQDTNGYMFSPRGEQMSGSQMDLWLKPEATARAWASDEMKAWWDTHGRLTRAQVRQAMIEGSGSNYNGEDFLR